MAPPPPPPVTLAGVPWPPQAEAEGRRAGLALAWDRLLNVLNAADASGHVVYASLLACQLAAGQPLIGPKVALALAGVAAGWVHPRARQGHCINDR
eukprot:8611230-Pyramimonas_sp.AAC.1